MAYEVEFTGRALRDFRKLDPPRRRLLMNAVQALAKDPYPPGSKRLQGNLHEYHRIRIDDARAIYIVDDEARKVLVVVAGHRRNVYTVAGRRLVD